MASYKIPAVVVVTEEPPRTSTGKLARTALLQSAQNAVGAQLWQETR
ncbi:MAG: hypothetical protein WCG47_27190 [Dermatophilaceae bacterium]